MMHEQRYAGLSSQDAAQAESFDNEFGHLTDPIKAMERKKNR